MTFLEAVGMALVTLLALIGLVTCLTFAWRGYNALRGTLDVGRLHEDAAVRDYLAGRIPGVRE
jgi:hypothetical protein